MVGIIGRAGPNLELHAVGGAATRDVQTLVAEDLDSPASEGPFLVGGVRAGFDGDD